MSILPHPPGTQDETGRNLTALAQQFPVTSQNIAHGAVGATQLATGVALLLASTGTTRKAAWGTGTVTFAASTTSGTATVSHGLGASPVLVLLTSNTSATCWLTNYSRTSTQFTVQGFLASSFTGSVGFDWFAIA